MLIAKSDFKGVLIIISLPSHSAKSTFTPLGVKTEKSAILVLTWSICVNKKFSFSFRLYSSHKITSHSPKSTFVKLLGVSLVASYTIVE